MSDVIVTYLNQGMGTLLNRAIDLFGVDVHSFLIGDAVDFTPVANETAPRGAITFTGDRSLVKIKYFDNDMTMRVSMTIPEDYNGIHIGNIVMYALDKGQIKPVVSISLPNVVIKEAVFPELPPSGQFKYPSTRLVISLTVKYVEQQPFDEVTINVVSPSFSNLPMFGHSTDLPDGAEIPYPQFIVNQMDSNGGIPAFVAKDDADSLWATPLFQDINAPKYGIIDGGNDGDDYIINRMKWVWGGLFITPDNKYKGIIQGTEFTGEPVNPVLIGFGSF